MCVQELKLTSNIITLALGYMVYKQVFILDINSPCWLYQVAVVNLELLC